MDEFKLSADVRRHLELDVDTGDGVKVTTLPYSDVRVELERLVEDKENKVWVCSSDYNT